MLLSEFLNSGDESWDTASNKEIKVSDWSRRRGGWCSRCSLLSGKVERLVSFDTKLQLSGSCAILENLNDVARLEDKHAPPV